MSLAARNFYPSRMKNAGKWACVPCINGTHLIRSKGKAGGELEVKNLAYRDKHHAIFENISFSASAGDIIGILGKNGAGKTTLMRCVAGLLKESSGEIYYHGKPIRGKDRNSICYMIMQDVNHQLFGESVWNECELSTDGTLQDAEIENR